MVKRARQWRRPDSKSSRSHGPRSRHDGNTHGHENTEAHGEAAQSSRKMALRTCGPHRHAHAKRQREEEKQQHKEDDGKCLRHARTIARTPSVDLATCSVCTTLLC